MESMSWVLGWRQCRGKQIAQLCRLNDAGSLQVFCFTPSCPLGVLYGLCATEGNELAHGIGLKAPPGGAWPSLSVCRAILTLECRQGAFGHIGRLLTKLFNTGFRAMPLPWSLTTVCKMSNSLAPTPCRRILPPDNSSGCIA